MADDSCFVLLLLFCPSLALRSGSPLDVFFFASATAAGHCRLWGPDEMQQADDLARFLEERARMLNTERVEANTEAPV